MNSVWSTPSMANRVTPSELGPHITGDEDRAVGVLTAAATLALD